MNILLKKTVSSGIQQIFELEFKSWSVKYVKHGSETLSQPNTSRFMPDMPTFQNDCWTKTLCVLSALHPSKYLVRTILEMTRLGIIRNRGIILRFFF